MSNLQETRDKQLYLQSIQEDINTHYTRELIYAIYNRDEIKINNLLELNITLKNQKEIMATLETEILSRNQVSGYYPNKIVKLNYNIYQYVFSSKTSKTCTTSFNTSHYHTILISSIQFKDVSLIFLAIYFPSKYAKELSCETMLRILQKCENINDLESVVIFDTKMGEYNVKLYETVNNVYKDSFEIVNFLHFDPKLRNMLTNYLKQQYLKISHLNRDVDSIIVKYAGWS
jgi:hypothetical protein